MSKVIQNKGGIGMGAPYDLPGYEYDPVTDKFKDLATGNTFDKDGNAKLENSKSVSITDNGTYEINPSATYDAMKKVALSVEVQGSADLEDNKAATIDVSAYTDPVEVTPTQGKDGMKKVTVSLSNIPAGANMLYAWHITYEDKMHPEQLDAGYGYYDFNVPPENLNGFSNSHTVVIDSQEFNLNVAKIGDNITVLDYEVSDEGVIYYETDDAYFHLTRDTTKDVEVWNAPPEVETTKQATIDVSTYDPANKPVITPTAGKQSMGSVEVTLDNIPSPSGSLTFYAWSTGSVAEGWTLSATPQVGDTFYPCDYNPDSIKTDPQALKVIASIGEGTINVDDSNYSRINEGDVTFPITPAP